MDHITMVDVLFVIRIVPLVLAGFITTRAKNWLGMLICILYLATTTVNYIYGNPALNAVFSTPLVFITCWYLIRGDIRNRRNRHIKLIKVRGVRESGSK